MIKIKFRSKSKYVEFLKCWPKGKFSQKQGFVQKKSLVAKACYLTVLWDKMQLLKTTMFLVSFGCCKRCLKYWYIQLET